MFERFTDRARRVVVLAQEEARRLDHGYIGTEHVLLGLLREDKGMAARALADVGISLAAVREQVFETVGPGDRVPSGHIPFTPRAKKVLELSLRESLQLGADYIGTEHLLLGLVREGEGVAAQMLIRFGGGLDAVRAAVLALCAQRPADVPGEERAPAGRESVDPAVRGPRRPRTSRYSARGGEPLSASVLREFLPGPARAPFPIGDPVVGRAAESDRLRAVLGRRERNNALIVGPSGAGKSALVRGLALRLAAEHGPAPLGGAEVVELDLPSLRTGVERLVRRRSAPVVLVEDLDTLLVTDGLYGGRTAMALAGLAEAEVPFVLTGTGAAYERLVLTYPALAARFEVIELAPADDESTMEVLRALRPGLAEFHRVVIEDSALAAAVALGSPAHAGRVSPGAAVDLLDTAAARVCAARPEGGGRAGVVGEEQVRAQADGPRGADGATAP